MSAEAENTFRALKDEKPIVTSHLCLVGWHKWTKWELTDTYRHSRGESLVGRSFIYKSVCVHCDIPRVKTIKETP